MKRTINIKSSLYDYSVEFVNDFADKLKEMDSHSIYIIDKNVYDLYKNRFKDINHDYIFFMDAVEGEKDMDTVMDIIMFFKSKSVRKNWKVICFGGGITQDVTTIASNLYLRNIDWYFFPTTLLSMCDSCIGGKCGINLGEYKNQIGVFYPPKKIFIDVHFIETLSRADYINGWGEILKFSLTSDEKFFSDLTKEKQYIPCENIEEYICRGLEVKKFVIEEDEFEGDFRRVLNYGHTFGHALETYTRNEVPHGQGVIWGIDVVNYIAYCEKLIDYDYYLQIKQIIKNYFLCDEIVIEAPDSLFDIIRTDKKVKDDIINLAMLDGKSHLIVYPMKINEGLKAYFEAFLKETHEYYSN